MSTLSVPPLLSAEAAPAGIDPFDKAVAAASVGCDSGLIVHNDGGAVLSAAIVLAPESPLEDAMAMVFAAGLGLSDALGALAPPEVAVHMVWPGGLLVNGAACGRLRAAASTRDPQGTPDWLVIGLDIALTRDGEPGDDPTRTALSEEGCAEIEPFGLLESWSRHMLVWINHWLDTGMTRLHTDWTGRLFNLGEDVAFELGGVRHEGVFVGIDERGGMLLRTAEGTTLIPLSAMLEG